MMGMLHGQGSCCDSSTVAGCTVSCLRAYINCALNLHQVNALQFWESPDVAAHSTLSFCLVPCRVMVYVLAALLSKSHVCLVIESLRVQAKPSTLDMI